MRCLTLIVARHRMPQRRFVRLLCVATELVHHCDP
jgi:hypothetical protein